MERYLNVTEARREFLGLIDEIAGGDRVVITKRGRPRAVLVDAERYALLEDAAWVLSDPARRAAMDQAWAELRGGEVVRLPRRAKAGTALLGDLVRSARKRSRRTNAP